MIPLFGSSLGAALVFFAGRKIKNGGSKVSRIIEGFSAGVMVAASIWSLLIPSIELSEKRGISGAFPAAVGFASGMCVFMIANRILHSKLSASGGDAGGITSMIAVAVHNLPEGMAVGAIFADVISGSPSSTLAEAMALSVGIAVQNVPEGAIISIPLRSKGLSRTKAFGAGVLSGIVEPLGAFFTILAAEIAIPFLPYLLSFAAGAMMVAVLEGLSEAGAGDSCSYCLSFCGGFCIMMCLDVILG